MARRMNPYRTPALAALVAFALPAAAPALAQDDFQQWLTQSAKADLSEKLAVHNELWVRFSDNRDGLYEIENSLLIGYKLSRKVAAWAGYVHNPNYAAGDFTVMERRAREQVTIDNFAKLGGASLSARLRFEQRWRDGIDGTGWRFRPYVKLAIPLGGKTAPTLNLSTEPFINFNNTAFQTSDGLERARSAIALSFPVSKAVKLEAGYLNQRRFVRGGRDTNDHALTASLAVSF
jgi:hypothetical protein